MATLPLLNLSALPLPNSTAAPQHPSFSGLASSGPDADMTAFPKVFEQLLRDLDIEMVPQTPAGSAPPDASASENGLLAEVLAPFLQSLPEGEAEAFAQLVKDHESDPVALIEALAQTIGGTVVPPVHDTALGSLAPLPIGGNNTTIEASTAPLVAVPHPSPSNSPQSPRQPTVGDAPQSRPILTGQSSPMTPPSDGFRVTPTIPSNTAPAPASTQSDGTGTVAFDPAIAKASPTTPPAAVNTSPSKTQTVPTLPPPDVQPSNTKAALSFLPRSKVMPDPLSTLPATSLPAASPPDVGRRDGLAPNTSRPPETAQILPPSSFVQAPPPAPVPNPGQQGGAQAILSAQSLEITAATTPSTAPSLSTGGLILPQASRPTPPPSNGSTRPRRESALQEIKVTNLPQAGTTITGPSSQMAASAKPTPPMIFTSSAGVGDNMGSSVTPLLSDDTMAAPLFAEIIHTTGQSAPQTPDMARHITRQIMAAMPSPGGQPIELRLNPEELGRVHLSMSQTDTSITVSIMAERGETLDLMRRHITLLETDFRDLGYEDISFSFGSSGGALGQRSGESQAAPDTLQGDKPSESTLQPSATTHNPKTSIANGRSTDGLDLRL